MQIVKHTLPVQSTQLYLPTSILDGMETVGDRIKKLRNALSPDEDGKRVSQEKLGEYAGGITKSAVSQWERNLTEPELDPLRKLRKNKNVSIDWVKDGIGEMFADYVFDTSTETHVTNEESLQITTDATKGPRLAKLGKISIVGTAEGGPDKEWVDMGYPANYGAEYVDAPSHDESAYALLISGNSMAPRMRPGEAIMVEPGHEPQPGDEVVAKTTDGSVMVKVYAAKRGSKIYLESISDDYEMIVKHIEEIEFLHYVAGVFRAGSIKERNTY